MKTLKPNYTAEEMPICPFCKAERITTNPQYKCLECKRTWNQVNQSITKVTEKMILVDDGSVMGAKIKKSDYDKQFASQSRQTVTDEMIREWAENIDHLRGDSGLTTNELTERIIGRDEGAKWMRSQSSPNIIDKEIIAKQAELIDKYKLISKFSDASRYHDGIIVNIEIKQLESELKVLQSPVKFK